MVWAGLKFGLGFWLGSIALAVLMRGGAAAGDQAAASWRSVRCRRGVELFDSRLVPECHQAGTGEVGNWSAGDAISQKQWQYDIRSIGSGAVEVDVRVHVPQTGDKDRKSVV